MTTAEELRDAITAEYEDMRAIFQRLRADDLAKPSAYGTPVWRVASEIAVAPRNDVRAAHRIVAGKSAEPARWSSPLTAITAWRRDRLFRDATRADFLAAWENSYNDLFACINDLAQEALDGEGPPEAARDAALQYLRNGIAPRHVKSLVLRRALGMPEPPGPD